MPSAIPPYRADGMLCGMDGDDSLSEARTTAERRRLLRVLGAVPIVAGTSGTFEPFEQQRFRYLELRGACPCAAD